MVLTARTIQSQAKPADKRFKLTCAALTSCKPTWMHGSRVTTSNDCITAAGATTKTPMQTFKDSPPLAKQKVIAA